MKYNVLRVHIGDRPYQEGDEREARPEDVAHLVAAGVLEEADEDRQAGKGRAKK